MKNLLSVSYFGYKKRHTNVNATAGDAGHRASNVQMMRSLSQQHQGPECL